MSTDAATQDLQIDQKNQLIGGVFQVIKLIGSGSFGEVYEGINLQNGQAVAIKMESTQEQYPQLMFEAKVYQQLGRLSGVPTIYHFVQDDSKNCMVLELLGPSLEDLFRKCKRSFSLKTVLMLADQMLRRIEIVHTRGFIHRDIKPNNFLMGHGEKSNKVFIIDFGLAKRLFYENSNMHIGFRNDRSLVGTVRYASIRAQKRIEQSRRDDLESLGFCLMYFNRGSLPWQGIKCENKKQKHEMILETKISTTISKLCKGFPSQFSIYMNYCRKLGFTEEPDYKYLRQLFCTLLNNMNLTYDYIYDWKLSEQEREWERAKRQMGKYKMAKPKGNSK